MQLAYKDGQRLWYDQEVYDVAANGSLARRLGGSEQLLASGVHSFTAALQSQNWVINGAVLPQAVTLPNGATLNGSGSDPDGSITSYTWTKVSGGNATINSPSSASTTVTGLQQGTYVFRLTVGDNSGGTASVDTKALGVKLCIYSIPGTACTH